MYLKDRFIVHVLHRCNFCLKNQNTCDNNYIIKTNNLLIKNLKRTYSERKNWTRTINC